MNWLSLVLCFVAGALVSNAVPHLTNGMSGRCFQTPFSKPQGPGSKSSPVVNVLWGSLNLAAGFILFSVVAGAGSVRATVLASAGALIMAVFNAWQFGRFNSDS